MSDGTPTRSRANEIVEAQIMELQRAMAAVDRFNPVYFRAIGAILLCLGGMFLGLALFGYGDNLIAKFYFALLGLTGVGATVVTYLEQVKYARRWRRSLTRLKRALHEAEGQAGWGFLAVDKARPNEGGLDEMRAKYLALTHEIRDAREMLGLKD